MQNFRELIDIMGGPAAAARAIACPAVTVRQWYNRNSVPAGYWSRMVAAARARALRLAEVTPEALSRLAASKANE